MEYTELSIQDRIDQASSMVRQVEAKTQAVLIDLKLYRRLLTKTNDSRVKIGLGTDIKNSEWMLVQTGTLLATLHEEIDELRSLLPVGEPEAED